MHKANIDALRCGSPAQVRIADPIRRKLNMHLLALELSVVRFNTDNESTAKTPMIAITIISSINVGAFWKATAGRSFEGGISFIAITAHQRGRALTACKHEPWLTVHQR